MANKRTVFPIPANTWVKVVDGATSAKIYRANTNVTYNSFVGTASGDTPSDTLLLTPTSEKMFMEEDSKYNEILSDSAAVYMWVKCDLDEVGELIVTL